MDFSRIREGLKKIHEKHMHETCTDSLQRSVQEIYQSSHGEFSEKLAPLSVRS